MLEKIRALAMEKLASEAEVDAFMEGFENATMEKIAAFASMFANPEVQKAALKTGMGLGASMIGALIVKGVASGYRHHETSNLRAKFEMALAQIMSTNKIIKGARPEKVREYAETLFKFAPHVSSDANLLSFVIANLLQGDTGSGIDLKTVEMVTNLESRYRDNNKTGPIATFKA